MKYGILIIAIVATFNLHGQQARMSSQALQAFEASIYATQITTDGAEVLISGNSAASPLSTITTIGSVVKDANCDIVVQEELIAGTAVGKNDDLGELDLFILKLKFWLRPSKQNK